MFTLHYANTVQVWDRSLWLQSVSDPTTIISWDTILLLLNKINTEYAGVYILPEFPPSPLWEGKIQRIVKCIKENKKINYGKRFQERVKWKRWYKVKLLWYCPFFPIIGFRSILFPFLSLLWVFKKGKESKLLMEGREKNQKSWKNIHSYSACRGEYSS